MWGWISALLTWAFGAIFPKKVDPSVITLADSNAHAEDAAAQETNNASLLNTALAARTAADVSVVRNDPAANEIHSDPGASVNKLDGEQFRD